MDRADGHDIIAAGQEEIVRALVAPSLPAGWTFLRARIARSEVRAHYLHPGPPRVQAELRLASPAAGDEAGVRLGRFRARLLVSGAAPTLPALRDTLFAAVRAREAEFLWVRAVPQARTAVPSPTSTAREPLPTIVIPAGPPPDMPRHDPPYVASADPPYVASADPEVLREARERFEAGAFDEALALLSDFAGTAIDREAVSALDLRAELMWELGRHPEALTALDAALARFPDSVRLLAAAATRRSEMYDPRAAEHARAVIARAGDTSGLGLRAASVLLSLGYDGEARAAIDRVLAVSPADSIPLLLDVAHLYRGSGAYDEAAELYERVLALDPAHVSARVAVGTLHAWRGDAGTARAHAETVLAVEPDHAPAHCLRGAARMLEGEAVAALEDFDVAARLDPTDPLAAVWRAEGLLRLGHDVEAAAEARRGGELSDDITHYVAAQLVVCLAQIRGGVFPGMPEYVLREVLATLQAEASPPPPGLFSEARARRNELDARLEDALGRLRGNRSADATYLRPDGALTRLTIPASPRVRAKRALWRFVATGDPADAMTEFDLIHADAPRAAEPYNYQGEMFLYLGDTAGARREFEQAIALYRQSRWAYIGLAGASVVEGDFSRALALLAEGIARAGAPGPTTFVYRGEALRRLGRLDEARSDLEFAVRRHPGRIGAWVNLALLDVSSGNLAGAAAHVDEIRRRARGFAADAADALGLDLAQPPSSNNLTALLEEMLTMLRGNRGASCVTYFTRTGQLRTVPPARGSS